MSLSYHEALILEQPIAFEFYRWEEYNIPMSTESGSHSMKLKGESGSQYTLGKELGRGGQAIVFEARTGHKTSAVKIPLVAGRDPSERERMIHNAGVEYGLHARASKIEGGVVPVEDVGITPDGVPFLVMERIDGPSLENTPDLSDHKKILLGMRLARTLSHLHTVAPQSGESLGGIIHRDIKSQNVLMMGDYPLVTDFGAAMVRDGDTMWVPDGQIIMTPRLVAPERLNTKASTDVPEGDVYNLAGTLYRICTGVNPFHSKDDNPWQYAYYNLRKDPPPFSTHLDTISPVVGRVEEVISEGMQKDYTRRPTAGEFVTMLLRALTEGVKEETRAAVRIPL